MSFLDSTRDQILQAMVSDGWANESDGAVESPSGYYAKISNTREEMNEIMGLESVRAVLAQQGFWVSGAFPVPVTDYRVSELIGHFLIVTDSNGNTTVETFDRSNDLLDAYRELDDAFNAWYGDDSYATEDYYL